MPKKTVRSELNLAQYINNKTVLNARVEACVRKSDGTEDMIAVLTGKEFARQSVYIKREDADINFSSGTVFYLVGFEIPVILLREEDGTIYASRKDAQYAKLTGHKTDFLEKKHFKGKILNFSPWGAFVDVDGVVGLLKHADYAVDRSDISEFQNIGDEVEVYCKAINSQNKILWAAVEPRKRDKPLEFEYTVGSVVLGRVVGINELSGNISAFVRVKHAIDIKCFLPYAEDVSEGDEVCVRIIHIEPGASPYMPPRVKGKIERLAF